MLYPVPFIPARPASDAPDAPPPMTAERYHELLRQGGSDYAKAKSSKGSKGK